MCGIAGYVNYATEDESRDVLTRMVRALARRGPDGNGMLVDGHCGLAHTRLSIIDIEGSPQPMRVSQSDVSLVYNGELFNYQNLRRELAELGLNFDTQGDTEVILRWLEREWETAPLRFDGMFGFAAWNRRTQVMLLGRDPMGVKPLFYAQPAPGLLVFGSEIKAVLEHPAVDGKLDENGLRQVLRFRAVYGGGTLYTGVRQLEPGTTLEFSRDGVKVRRYYCLEELAQKAGETIHGKPDGLIGEQVGAMLDEAVRKRLVADVPVGAFLSGGIDSSVIACLMKRFGGGTAELHTFAVGFSDDPYSELPAARLAAAHVGSMHHETIATPALYASRLAELSACRDGPISEPADVAIAEMSRESRKIVKVVLSGEGADELFAGYPKYRFAKSHALTRAALRAVGASRASRMAAILGIDRRRALVAARAISLPDEIDRLVQWFSYIDRDQLKSLMPGLGWDDQAWANTTKGQAAALARARGLTPLGRMQFLDCLTWLPCNLLERGDRMTMAEGLEMRVPFLDKAIAPLALALPDRMKVKGRRSKVIVRDYAARILPPDICSRKKWGFRVPLAAWFRGALESTLNDYLRSKNGICGRYGDRESIFKLIDAHRAGRIDANLTLWTLLVAEIWYQDVYLKR